MQTTQSSNTGFATGSVIYTTGTTTNPPHPTQVNITPAGRIFAPGGTVTDAESVTAEELRSEVFNTPIETLINVWLSRFSHEWVDLDMIEDDKFFRLAYRRLKSMGELEQHYLTDRARFVCRKPE